MLEYFDTLRAAENEATLVLMGREDDEGARRAVRAARRVSFPIASA